MSDVYKRIVFKKREMTNLKGDDVLFNKFFIFQVDDLVFKWQKPVVLEFIYFSIHKPSNKILLEMQFLKFIFVNSFTFSLLSADAVRKMTKIMLIKRLSVFS